MRFRWFAPNNPLSSSLVPALWPPKWSGGGRILKTGTFHTPWRDTKWKERTFAQHRCSINAEMRSNNGAHGTWYIFGDYGSPTSITPCSNTEHSVWWWFLPCTRDRSVLCGSAVRAIPELHSTRDWFDFSITSIEALGVLLIPSCLGL